MQTLLRITVLAAFLSMSCVGVATEMGQRSSQNEGERVLAAEDQYVAAEIDRDEAALRRLVDDRFVHNSNKGTTSDKEALVRSILAMNMTGQTVSERTVMVEGDVAFIFGTAEIRHRDAGSNEQTTALRYTSAYVKRQGQWRMIALHMAPRSS